MPAKSDMKIKSEEAVWLAANNPSKPSASDVIILVAKELGMTPLELLGIIGGFANYATIVGHTNISDRFAKLNTSI